MSPCDWLISRSQTCPGSLRGAAHRSSLPFQGRLVSWSFQRRAPAPPPGVARSASGASPRSEPSLASPPTGLSSRQRSRSCRTRAAFSGLFWMVPRPQRRGPRLPRLPRLRVRAAPGFSPAGWVSHLAFVAASQPGRARCCKPHARSWISLVPPRALLCSRTPSGASLSFSRHGFVGLSGL